MGIREQHKKFTDHHGLTMPNLSTTFLFLLLLTTFFVNCACTASQEMNCTDTIGDCLADHSDEFMMDSETSTMLFQAKSNQILYKGLQRPQLCNAKVYSSCFEDKKGNNGRCATISDRCKHCAARGGRAGACP